MSGSCHTSRCGRPTNTAPNEAEKEAFRKLNHSLHGIEVLTYTDLLKRGENLIKVYADDNVDNLEELD